MSKINFSQITITDFKNISASTTKANKENFPTFFASVIMTYCISIFLFAVHWNILNITIACIKLNNIFFFQIIELIFICLQLLVFNFLIIFKKFIRLSPYPYKLKFFNLNLHTKTLPVHHKKF